MAEEAGTVWKVTLYMTDRQWRELSMWSAPRAARETAPWLYLEHEQCPEKEYEEKQREAMECASRSITPEQIIYTVVGGSTAGDTTEDRECANPIRSISPTAH